MIPLIPSQCLALRLHMCVQAQPCQSHHAASCELHQQPLQSVQQQQQRRVGSKPAELPVQHSWMQLLQVTHASVTTALSESRLCPTLLDVAVTASTIGELRSGHPRRCSRVGRFHCQRFNSLPPLSERLAYNGRACVLVDKGWKQLCRRCASLSIVGRWEHKIKDVLVDRLHRPLISCQLDHSALACNCGPILHLSGSADVLAALVVTLASAACCTGAIEPCRPVSYLTLLYLCCC